MRPCAGDLELGRTFLRSIEPFVYRRYLSAVEIAEIQAMKRRIENRARSEGVSRWDVKTGFGGIRDIEFVVQFLQLLNGCTLPSLREPNTIRSLGLLKSAGCLTPIEHDALLRNYVFLRNTEHRLQLEEDRQTHRIPQKIESRRTLALLMGFNPLNAWESAEGPFERFLHQYVKLTEENNAILNRLLHDAFRTEDSTCADPASDLILDPEMPSDVQNRILDSFGLIDKPRVIRHLECMAREEKPYFSTPRCRHFFAAIAPKLLQRIAQTPNPEATLAQVDTITQVLPVKGLLWESLSSSIAALDGFVSMASENRFVADLIQARPRVWENWYRVIVREYPESPATFEPPRLSANANPLERLAALREARDQRWLEIAAGHPLPLTVDSVRSMGKMASAVADMTIRAIAETLWNDQAARTSAGFAKPPGSWAILALGKLGSESLSFHSDLDLVFMHEADPALTSAKDKNAAERYFGDLASRFLKSASERGPGFLYRVDTRLRPFGGSGSLSVPLCQMRAYYRSGDARVWERLALLRARPLFVAGFDAEKLLAETVALAFVGCTEAETVRGELAAVRERIRRSIEANPDDLKRSEGGSQAIELLVQALQLIGYDKSSAHVERDEFAAIGNLTETGRISIQQAKSLTEAYGLYRQVDWALRLFRNRVPDPFRIDPKEWPYLERMIDSPVDPKISLNDRIERARSSVREIVRQFLEGNL
jgi:glutamate-ammonia-ligase adenylyltransferase